MDYNIIERASAIHSKAAAPKTEKSNQGAFPLGNKGVRAENFVFSTKSCFIAVADRDLASPTKPDFPGFLFLTSCLVILEIISLAYKIMSKKN